VGAVLAALDVPASLDRRHDGMINLSRLCRKVEENLVAFSQVRTEDFWGTVSEARHLRARVAMSRIH
jgi:hypothetical protein